MPYSGARRQSTHAELDPTAAQLAAATAAYSSASNVVLETDGRYKPALDRVALAWCEPAGRAHTEWHVLRDLRPADCAGLGMGRLRAELRVRPEVDTLGLHSRSDLAGALADAIARGETEPVVTLASHHLEATFVDGGLLPGREYTYSLQAWDAACGWVDAGNKCTVRTLADPAAAAAAATGGAGAAGAAGAAAAEPFIEAPALDWFTYQNVYAEFVRNFKSDPWCVE
jgi:hypothetical protein